MAAARNDDDDEGGKEQQAWTVEVWGPSMGAWTRGLSMRFGCSLNSLGLEVRSQMADGQVCMDHEPALVPSPPLSASYIWKGDSSF
mmetsp:Transcript_17827/g.52045  ORF Transcript_17827/g.52045 Transcript_17827/m.52045 type:complete len:86 (-) Transcript_17827:131-388(-)